MGYAGINYALQAGGKQSQQLEASPKAKRETLLSILFHLPVFTFHLTPLFIIFLK
jgi:hypothetical protein